MLSTVGRLTTSSLAGLLVVSGGASAQSVSSSIVTDAPSVVRAAMAFFVVAVVGYGFLTWRRGALDSAVEDTIDRPKVAVAYGLVAFFIVAFFGLFANNLLVQSGLTTTPLTLVMVGLLVVGVAVVGGLGFVVVGTLLTGLNGPHRPQWGVLYGAILSALCWVAVPLAVSFAAWVLVASFGVGGTTRTWVHNERTVANDA